jgi:RNA polymerase sigma-70 factor, ECF subfamily
MHPSIEQIYDAHADALYAFLLNCCRDEPLVQDAIQEVFLKLARNPSLLRNALHTRAFLLRTAHNALRDFTRRNATRVTYEQRLIEQSPTLLLPIFPIEDDGFRLTIETAMESLPEEQRSVLHLKHAAIACPRWKSASAAKASLRGIGKQASKPNRR